MEHIQEQKQDQKHTPEHIKIQSTPLYPPFWLHLQQQRCPRLVRSRSISSSRTHNLMFAEKQGQRKFQAQHSLLDFIAFRFDSSVAHKFQTSAWPLLSSLHHPLLFTNFPPPTQSQKHVLFPKSSSKARPVRSLTPSSHPGRQACSIHSNQSPMTRHPPTTTWRQEYYYYYYYYFCYIKRSRSYFNARHNSDQTRKSSFWQIQTNKRRAKPGESDSATLCFADNSVHHSWCNHISPCLSGPE